MYPVLKQIKTKKNNHYCGVILLQNKLVIGRQNDCNFRIPYIDISRKHAEIKFKENKWIIKDLNSTNGLFVNDVQLMPNSLHCLKIYDKITFGAKDKSEFVYFFIPNYKRFYGKNFRKKQKNVAHDHIYCRKEKSKINLKRLVSKKNFEEIFDSELECTICKEIFIYPVTLNCSHTFCLFCIDKWKNLNNICPICRIEIISQTRVLDLESLIDRFYPLLKPKNKKYRDKLVKKRLLNQSDDQLQISGTDRDSYSDSE